MDRPEQQDSLLEAARIVARGGDLDSKLDALRGHAMRAAGAASAAVLLYDTATSQLVTLDGTATIEPNAADDALASAVRDRRPAASSGDDDRDEVRTLLPGQSRVLVPLVTEDEQGGPEVEGVLGVGFSHSGPASDAVDSLVAVADLMAVAIRQTRLENALMERVEYDERLANTDLLTGLANRRTFDQMLELELVRASRQGSPVSLALFDIDGFAALSEAGGGSAGDHALRQVARTLADQVRLVDTVARVGGDEFGVIAPGEGGLVVATRIRDAVAASPPINGVPLSIRAGVARYPSDGESSAQLLGAANDALAAARDQGPGAVVSSDTARS